MILFYFISKAQSKNLTCAIKEAKPLKVPNYGVSRRFRSQNNTDKKSHMGQSNNTALACRISVDEQYTRTPLIRVYR